MPEPNPEAKKVLAKAFTAHMQKPHVQERIVKENPGVGTGIGGVVAKFGTRLVKKGIQLAKDPLGSIPYYVISSLPVPGIDEQLAEDAARLLSPNFKRIQELDEGTKNMWRKIALVEFKRMIEENPQLRLSVNQHNIYQKETTGKMLPIMLTKPILSLDRSKLNAYVTARHNQANLARLQRNPHNDHHNYIRGRLAHR